MSVFRGAELKYLSGGLQLGRIATVGADGTPHVVPVGWIYNYASLRAALRDDPVYIAEQLGHRDARFTFRVYQRAAKRRERLVNEHLAVFDRALEWAGNGQGAAAEAIPGQPASSAQGPGTGAAKLESPRARL
jgi:Pyridoxamine 5'-phosphate oxidase